MPKQLFGTDGIRGTPGEFPLDDRTLYWTGFVLGEYVRHASPIPRVLLGMDTRESGPRITARIAAGLASAGAATAFAGVITTPGVAWLVRRKDFSAGVVISASHNPYQDNGVKVFSSTGTKLPDETEEELEQQILRWRDYEITDGRAGLRADPSLDAEYLSFLRSCAIPGTRLASLRIVLDCANGAASQLGPALFRSLGAEVIPLFDQPDGRNINAGCGSMHPAALQRAVVEQRAALGVAFDGDADRAVFASASGRLVNGDGTLLLAARHLTRAGQLKSQRIIGTTMANLGLERALAADGLTLVRVPVGDRYVLEEMQHWGANLGGEQSGHIIFLDDAPTGDGLLTALKVACIISLEGPLDELVRGLKVFPQTIRNVRVRAKPPLETLPEVARVLDEANRALGNSGRIVLRYSGTEPLARVMVEAEREEDVERWAAAIASAIQATIGI